MREVGVMYRVFFACLQLLSRGPIPGARYRYDLLFPNTSGPLGSDWPVQGKAQLSRMGLFPPWPV